MKITTLIPLIVLGTSTAAFASPQQVSMAQPTMRDHRRSMPAPLVRDHRHPMQRPAIAYPRPSYQPSSYEPRYTEPVWTYQPRSTSDWTQYGETMSFVATDGRRSAEIGASEGIFRGIRVTGTTGSPYIMMVQAVFTDGTTHMFMARRTLHRGQSVEFQLDTPSPLLRVTVFTHDDGRLVESSTGTFSISAL